MCLYAPVCACVRTCVRVLYICVCWCSWRARRCTHARMHTFALAGIVRQWSGWSRVGCACSLWAPFETRSTPCHTSLFSPYTQSHSVPLHACPHGFAAGGPAVQCYSIRPTALPKCLPVLPHCPLTVRYPLAICSFWIRLPQTILIIVSRAMFVEHKDKHEDETVSS